MQIPIRIGNSCQVFMGAGWEKGKLVHVGIDRVIVELKNRVVCVYDARNIK